jgi:hypothetical protein
LLELRGIYEKKVTNSGIIFLDEIDFAFENLVGMEDSNAPFVIALDFELLKESVSRLVTCVEAISIRTVVQIC